MMREGAKKQFARKLRQHMTDAEQHLWKYLRRQHPIGPFITDFACIESKIIIEIDGGQHVESASDQQRDAWLSAQGFQILRFWNNDVLNRTDNVVAGIFRQLTLPDPHPSLPPLAGEGAEQSSVGEMV